MSIYCFFFTYRQSKCSLQSCLLSTAQSRAVVLIRRFSIDKGISLILFVHQDWTKWETPWKSYWELSLTTNTAQTKGKLTQSPSAQPLLISSAINGNLCPSSKQLRLHNLTAYLWCQHRSSTGDARPEQWCYGRSAILAVQEFGKREQKGEGEWHGELG